MATSKTNQAKIYLIDVTNRDGVQTARISLAKLEKTILNILLSRIGVFQSEAGFPFAKHEINYFNANLELSEAGALGDMRISGWCLARKDEIDSCFRNVPKLRHINISVSTSDQMIFGKFQGKKTRKDIIDMMRESVQFARKRGAKTIGVNAEDASRTNLDFLIQFSKAAKKEGAEMIRYCDTLGYDDPFTIKNRINAIAKAVKMPVEIHCHNDLGMAVANSIAGAKGAMRAGVDAYINTTVNGVGERAGNADLVSVLLAIKKSTAAPKLALGHDINLKNAWSLARYASHSFGIPIPINQPGVGANAFAHESGIHADGALKDRRNYELYDHEELGISETETVRKGRTITVGEYSGLKGMMHVYSNLDVKLKENERARVLEIIRHANAHTQKPLTEEELVFIAQYPHLAEKIVNM